MSHLPRFEQNKAIYQKMESIAFKCLLNPNFKPAEKRYRYTDKRTDRKTNGKTLWPSGRASGPIINPITTKVFKILWIYTLVKPIINRWSMKSFCLFYLKRVTSAFYLFSLDIFFQFLGEDSMPWRTITITINLVIAAYGKRCVPIYSRS